MITIREIALEQALVAVIGEAILSGLKVEALIHDAVDGLRGGAKYQCVGYPHIENAVHALISAYALTVRWSQEQ